jgi:predicted metalloprotease with PDZ domain
VPAAAIAAALLFAPPTVARAATAAAQARYVLEVRDEVTRWHVRAQLPIAGAALRMDDSRPFGVAELDSLGWPGLVRSFRVTRPDGETLGVSRAGASGWRLARPETTTVTLDYEVDLAPLARERWPAMREAAWRDPSHLSLVGRALFVTTEASRDCDVEFVLPRGWSAYTPWRAAGARARFRAASPSELVENLLVISREPARFVRAGGFRVQYLPTGWWLPAGPEVRRVLGSVLRHHTAVMGSRESRDYLVLLLPQVEHGGEAYRASFALTVEARPDSGPSGAWGNLVAHELFHQWNGWQLQGADYASSQWFQEGFTEYEANRAMLAADAAGEEGFRARLAGHIRNSRRLTTTLENIGTRKGPPLYSAGALVAFIWDVRIRAATAGRANLSDFMRALLRGCDQGRRAYRWPDIRAALEATAPGDWESFHSRFIAGSEPLPIAEALSQAGLKLVEGADSVRVQRDPAAGAEAVRCRRQLLRGD